MLEPERGKSLVLKPDSRVSMSTSSPCALLGPVPCAVLPDVHAAVDLNTRRNPQALCHSGGSPGFNTLISCITFSRNQAVLDVRAEFKGRVALPDTGFTEVEAHLKIQLGQRFSHTWEAASVIDYVFPAAEPVLPVWTYPSAIDNGSLMLGLRGVGLCLYIGTMVISSTFLTGMGSAYGLSTDSYSVMHRLTCIVFCSTEFYF